MDARQSGPTLIGDDADSFYAVSGNAIVEKMLDNRQIIAPARDSFAAGETTQKPHFKLN